MPPSLSLSVSAIRVRCDRWLDSPRYRYCDVVLAVARVDEIAGHVYLDLEELPDRWGAPDWDQGRSRPHLRLLELRGDQRAVIECSCGAHWVVKAERIGPPADTKAREGLVDAKGQVDVPISELLGK